MNFFIKIGFSIALLFFVIWLGTVFFDNNKEVTTVNSLQTSIELPLKKEESVAILTTIDTENGSGQTLNLSEEFNRAVNYRYLFESLKNTKTANGSFYRLKIIERCMKIKNQNLELRNKIISVDHRIAYERDRIATRHQILCGQFLEGEISNENYSQILRKEGGEDILKTISNLKRLDSKDNFHCNNLRRLFDSNSPEAIGAASIYSDARGDYFDGKFYAANDPTLRNGMKLALCNLGQDCSSGNFEVENLCLLKGICENSLKEALKQDLKRSNRSSENEYKEIILLADRISNSIKSMSLSNFTPFNCS